MRYMKPLVSVVMPAHNSERFIRQAIQSVRRQTIDDWELWVIDDGSTDRTESIVRDMAAGDPRIHLIRREESGGAARARNEGFSQCRGQYVALLDSDDIWLPDKLKFQCEAAEKVSTDIVYCSYAIIDERNQRKCADFIVPETVSYPLALVKSVMSCSTVLLRREVTEEYQFPLEHYHEDLAYWLELLKAGKTSVGVSDVLAGYRIGAETKSSNKINTEKKRWHVYRDFCHYSVLTSTVLTGISSALGVYKYRWVPKRLRKKRWSAKGF